MYQRAKRGFDVTLMSQNPILAENGQATPVKAPEAVALEEVKTNHRNTLLNEALIRKDYDNGNTSEGDVSE